MGEITAEIRIIPLGTASTGLSNYIAACLNPVKEAKDIRYQITAMGTIVQGPMKRILELAQQMHEMPFTMGVQRVTTIINIDDRRDKSQTTEEKVKAVS